MDRLKPCPVCGYEPVIEHWTSGNLIFAVRCNNPARPSICSDGFYLSRSNSKEQAIKKWNEWASR